MYTTPNEHELSTPSLPRNVRVLGLSTRRLGRSPDDGRMRWLSLVRVSSRAHREASRTASKHPSRGHCAARPWRKATCASGWSRTAAGSARHRLSSPAVQILFTAAPGRSSPKLKHLILLGKPFSSFLLQAHVSRPQWSASHPPDHDERAVLSTGNPRRSPSIRSRRRSSVSELATFSMRLHGPRVGHCGLPSTCYLPLCDTTRGYGGEA